MKPVGRCQGQGISLVSRAAQVGRWAPQAQAQAQAQQQGQQRQESLSPSDDDNRSDDDDERQRSRPGSPAAASAPPAAAPDALRARYGAAYCAQRYVESPYLIAGRKFDLRIYALVTAHHVSGGGGGAGGVGGVGVGLGTTAASAVTAPPHLRVYLHRSGFARFAGSRYSMRKGDLADARVHLTNVAVQKKQPRPLSAAAGASDGTDRPASPTTSAPPPPPPPALKWSLRELRLHLAQRHGRNAADALFSSIQSLVVKALLAVQGQVRADRRCFELYGYDVLIDSSLRPWLLEVNASPSLTASDADDRALKFAMLHDALDVVGVERAAAAFGGGGLGGGGGVVVGGGIGGAVGAGAASPLPPRRVGGFDLVWDGGPVGGGGGAAALAGSGSASSSSSYASAQASRTLGPSSMLGCYNERDEGMWPRRWGGGGG
jgi:tubulin polyglutamylase TTLL9